MGFKMPPGFLWGLMQTFQTGFGAYPPREFQASQTHGSTRNETHYKHWVFRFNTIDKLQAGRCRRGV